MRQTGPRIAMNKFLFSNRRNRTRKVENLSAQELLSLPTQSRRRLTTARFLSTTMEGFSKLSCRRPKSGEIYHGNRRRIWKKKLKKESQRVENETYGQVEKSEMGEGWRVRWAKGGQLDGCGGKGSSCREGRGRRRFSLVRLVNPELPACVEKCWRERM